MGSVVALNGQTVGELLEQLNKQHADGDLKSLIVAATDSDNNVNTGITVMTIERAVYLADTLMQDARNA